MKKKILTYYRGRCIYTASRARHICMLRDNWPVIDWREPIGLQERLEGRSSHNGVISVMSRDSLKGNQCYFSIEQSNLGIQSQAFPLLEFSPALESWSDIYMSLTSCLIVTTCLHRMQADAAIWQIPDSKLPPRSIYDVLTRISNNFQRSLCHIQCRPNVTGQLSRPM